MNKVLPSGFIPLEDQGMIYGIVQTPPGSTLEYTNSKSHELAKICKDVREVTSVSSLAGYEVLTEGRGSNAGTCLINLKPWTDRNRTSKQIIEELEERGRKIANVKLEFFEPPRFRVSVRPAVSRCACSIRRTATTTSVLGRIRRTSSWTRWASARS